MTDEIKSTDSIIPIPGSVQALQELVDQLVLVDIAGTAESDDRPLDATYRAALQNLVASEMKRDDIAPDLHAVLTAALEKWAEYH